MTLKEKYRKIRKALRDQISRLKRQGYSVSIELPTIPKRITPGSIRKLEKIKQNLWQYVSYEGATGYGARRKRAAERAEQRQKEPKTPEEPTPETETEPEPEEFAETEESFIPPEAEIIYAAIVDEINRGLSSERPVYKRNASYVLGQWEQALTDTDFETFMENLAETDPEALQEAQAMIWDSLSQYVSEDKLTHHWYRLLKFGELLTEQEARGVEPDSYPDEGENWNDGSWENLMELGDVFGKYDE